MHLLLDIEGTTTAMSFVADELFPYAAARLPGFLEVHGADPAVRAAMVAVLADATAAERALPERAAVLAVVHRQMAADSKAGGLKQLQGLVWREGYETGWVQGHVYPDVAPALAAAAAAGRRVRIYSSGSVLAQQLLFRHSVAGDLGRYLDGYHDTASGPKREAGSYRRIAADWGVAPEAIRFATDQPAEAAAAAEAGLDAVLVMRPGNAPLPAGLPFPVHGDLGRL